MISSRLKTRGWLDELYSPYGARIREQEAADHLFHPDVQYYLGDCAAGSVVGGPWRRFCGYRASHLVSDGQLCAKRGRAVHDWAGGRTDRFEASGGALNSMASRASLVSNCTLWLSCHRDSGVPHRHLVQCPEPGCFKLASLLLGYLARVAGGSRSAWGGVWVAGIRIAPNVRPVVSAYLRVATRCCLERLAPSAVLNRGRSATTLLVSSVRSRNNGLELLSDLDLSPNRQPLFDAVAAPYVELRIYSN